MAQGGDISFGQGGDSIYGGAFADEFERGLLRHDRRGLLTRKQFQAGPEFGITLGPATSLNGGWEVFGRVSSDESGLLKLMEGLPYITGRSLEEPGSVSDGIFNAQKGLFGGLAKGMGDARAEQW